VAFECGGLVHNHVAERNQALQYFPVDNGNVAEAESFMMKTHSSIVSSRGTARGFGVMTSETAV